MPSGFVGALAACLLLVPAAKAVDLDSLWDFSQPEVSEERFRDALREAKGDDAIILETQIARTYGLRAQFDLAREVLRGLAPRLEGAGPEARTRYELELGRTYASAAHPPDSLTAEDKETARAAYRRALDTARAARLDGLSIDAIHMMAFVDTSAADQRKWAEAALEVVESSEQPEAKRWEASIRNNLGYALHRAGRYEDALAQFQQAVVLRERGDDAEATRIAHWMVAWTLRAMHRFDEALAIQLRLERECDDAGQPDRYVFEELEALYRAKGDLELAKHYQERREAQP